MEKIIYDFGANTGQDITYYLLKSDKVIAVEANPSCCRQIEDKFAHQIANGRLLLINKALVAPLHGQESPSNVVLHVPRKGYKPGLGDAHSTIVNPAEITNPYFADPEAYELISVPAVRPSEIVKEHGYPYYIKVDIEHYDHNVLGELFSAQIYPEYISSECHTAKVFSLMTACGAYDKFKIVIGREVGNTYLKCPIEPHPVEVTREVFGMPFFKGLDSSAFDLKCEFNFRTGMSGPFGNDIPGPWLSADEVFKALADSGLGWIDLHASNCRD